MGRALGGRKSRANRAADSDRPIKAKNPAKQIKAQPAFFPKLLIAGLISLAGGGLAYGLSSHNGRSNRAHDSLMSSSTPGALPTTTVPSTSPSSVGAPAVPTPGGASIGVGGFDAVTCPTATLCVAVGANANKSGVVATSSDGGLMWSSHSIPSGAPELDAVACANTEDCVAVGSDAALSTTDGGESWSTQALPSADSTLLGVTCTSTLLCVICQPHGTS